MVSDEATYLNVKLKGRPLEILNEVIAENNFETNAEAVRFIFSRFDKYEKALKQVLDDIQKDLGNLANSNERMLNIIDKLEFRLDSKVFHNQGMKIQQ